MPRSPDGSGLRGVRDAVGKRVMKFNRFGLVGLSAIVAVVGSAAPAFAIPTNPDPLHSAAATPWSSVPIGVLNQATDAHQHWNTDNLNGVNGKFKTYAAWDDNVYRYNSVADRKLTKAQDGADYGHGFMQNAATYGFSPGNGLPNNPAVPAVAQALFNTVVFDWMTSVNQAGVNNVNGVPVETKINWANGGVGAITDITIRFASFYPVGASFPGGAGNKNFPDEVEIGSDGTWGGNPGGGAGAGIDGTLAYWTPSSRVLTFNSKINWYYTDAMNPLNDLLPTHAADQFDFVTVAMHEFGHVLGLDHPTGANLNTTMQPTLPRRGGLPGHVGIFRTIDGGTIDGARSLYTIAVPTPAGAMLLGIGGVFAMRRRR